MRLTGPKHSHMYGACLGSRNQVGSVKRAATCCTMKTSICLDPWGIMCSPDHRWPHTRELGLNQSAGSTGMQAQQEGRRRRTSLPTFWMQPSCDDTSASVSICCKTIWKRVVSFREHGPRATVGYTHASRAIEL